VDILVSFAKDRWKEFNSIVDDENLTSKEKLLLVIIFRYVNHITGYASPSRKQVKKLARITDNRTLDNPLDSLIAKGCITREKGNGVNSRVEKNRQGEKVTYNIYIYRFSILTANDFFFFGSFLHLCKNNHPRGDSIKWIMLSICPTHCSSILNS
jgi:hypothetical protein